MQRLGRDLTRVQTLLITHEHHDHFSPRELAYRRRGFVSQDSILPRLSVYGNQEVMRLLSLEIPEQ